MKTLQITFTEALRLKPEGIKRLMLNKGMTLYPQEQITNFDKKIFTIKSKGINDNDMVS